MASAAPGTTEPKYQFELRPWQRCTTAIFFLWLGWIIVYPILIWLLFTPYFWIPVAICTWMLIDRSHNHGGRSWRPLRDSSISKFWYQYFPVSLHITAPEEIRPNSNYIFACHPHGMFATGVTCAFATEGLGISKRLPGMRLSILVSSSVFAFPVFREGFLWLGCSAISQRNMENIAKSGTGNVMVLVPGGVAEMFESRPGTNRLVLECRKGFVRVALQTGCHLVPVYSFGETELFHQVFENPVGSRARALQRWVGSLTGFPLVPFYGRSKIFFWQPSPKPVHVVVGKPLMVQQVSHPSEKEIDDLHSDYKKALKALFDEHKALYGFDESELEIT